ncbi:hypothetical protein N752_01560 [Desulforamulus aquiferis]|nr:hypothetical protein N752_01560 [Desulforamulus aquiferis]
MGLRGHGVPKENYQADLALGNFTTDLLVAT